MRRNPRTCGGLRWAGPPRTDESGPEERGMSARIVSIRGGEQRQTPLGNLEDIDADYTRAVRALVNSKVRIYVAGGGRMQALALRAGVTRATVRRLAYYETTRPTWHTTMAVIMALGVFGDFAELTQRHAERHARRS